MKQLLLNTGVKHFLKPDHRRVLGFTRGNDDTKSDTALSANGASGY